MRRRGTESAPSGVLFHGMSAVKRISRRAAGEGDVSAERTLRGGEKRGGGYSIVGSNASNSGVEKNSPSVMFSPSQISLIVSSFGF